MAHLENAKKMVIFYATHLLESLTKEAYYKA